MREARKRGCLTICSPIFAPFAFFVVPSSRPIYLYTAKSTEKQIQSKGNRRSTVVTVS